MSAKVEPESEFEQAFTGNGNHQSGMSQDELIHSFARLDAAFKSMGDERREVALQLAGIAFENKGDQNTVRLTSSDGMRVTCQFGSETEYDPEQMFVIADLLGKDVFDGLFQTKVEFKAKKRNLNAFLNTVHSDEASETAKQLIREATTEKPKTPYVSMDRK